MLQIAIILGWILAVVVLLYLVVQAARHRFIRRDRKSSAKLFKKRRPSDQKNRDPVKRTPSPEEHAAHKAHEAHLDFRRVMTIVGVFALFLWEAFWISGITDRFRWSANPFQLPYFFLFIVLIAIPVAVYFIARRMIRRSAPSS